MSKLKEYRISKHLSQSYLANQAKVTLRMYQYYETELKVPTVYVALRIARALDTTVEELFPIEDER